MTLRQLLRDGICLLEDAGVPDAELDARILLMDAFHIDAAHFLILRERMLDEGEETEEGVRRYRDCLKLRSLRVPLQHVLGRQEFMGMEFLVGPDVLIPRQDTEKLVEIFLEGHAGAGCRVLDLCTGSGCIAISLAALGGCSFVMGTDISEEALAIARVNGERLLEGRGDVSWRKSDLFEGLSPFREPGRRFDVLVSNPPYIPSEVIEGLEPEVRDHEPRAALDGERDGLAFYRRIASEGGRYLNHGGRAYLEIGHDQAGPVGSLLAASGFCGIQVVKDETGLDRVMSAVWP